MQWRQMLLGCALVTLAACTGNEPAGGPSVVLITVDTLRADHLSSYGFGLETSPHIDALSREGALFERAIAASNGTAPSHASIMTSRYIRQHSIGFGNGDTRLEGLATLAEILREAGYATGGFVGNIVLQRRTGLDQGFEVYDDELPHPELNRPFIFERTAGETTTRALEWLETAPEPFFLWVHYQDPHGPYFPPSDYAGGFALPADPDEEPLPVLDDNSGYKGVPAYQALPGLTRPSEYRARYADEIRYADGWIGKLLASPRVRDAVLVFTSDHGESMGEEEHYFVHQSTTLPPEAHVPLLVRAPGIEPGRFGGVVSHVDILPTILELVGVTPPAELSGVALGPYLRAGEPLPDRTVFCDMGSQASAYRGGVFLNVRRVSRPESSDDAPRAVSKAYRWKGEESGSDGRDPEELKNALRDYLRHVVPMVEAEPLPPEDVERMRALGYVD